jgi:hypothetical protein
MTEVVYQVVEHDGGWAYKVGGTYSETFPTRDAAHHGAARAAVEQQRPGEDAGIEYEDEQGRWKGEVAAGEDRPQTKLKD